MNVAQHKAVNLLKTLWDVFFVVTCHNVSNVWPKTTLLLPGWPRDSKRLDTPALQAEKRKAFEWLITKVDQFYNSLHWKPKNILIFKKQFHEEYIIIHSWDAAYITQSFHALLTPSPCWKCLPHVPLLVSSHSPRPSSLEPGLAPPSLSDAFFSELL